MWLQTTVPKFLLRKLLLETFVKDSRNRMLPKTYQGKVPLKTTISKCCSKNYRSKRLSHNPCASRKARQKSCPRTMDGTPEVGNRRNNPLLEKTGPRGRGRLAEPRKPGSRQRKMEEPYQKKKSRNDEMGEANERVDKKCHKNNRTKILSRKLPLETFIKIMRDKMLPKILTVLLKATLLEICTKNYRSKRSSKDV